jgi:hypothetical protein
MLGIDSPHGRERYEGVRAQRGRVWCERERQARALEEENRRQYQIERDAIYEAQEVRQQYGQETKEPFNVWVTTEDIEDDMKRPQSEQTPDSTVFIPVPEPRVVLTGALGRLGRPAVWDMRLSWEEQEEQKGLLGVRTHKVKH